MSAGPGRAAARPVPDHRCRAWARPIARPDAVSLAVAGGLLALTVAIGWIAAAEVRLPVRRDVLRAVDLDLVLGIASQNVIVAVTLFSGVATAAVSTLVAVPMLGIYIGVVLRAAVTALGPAGAGALLVPFVVVELAAFVLAAACGLRPALAALAIWRAAACPRVRPAATAYLGTAGATLSCLPVVLVLLVVAALLEAVAGVPG